MADQDINTCICDHPKWSDVQLIEPVKVLENKRVLGVATLLCKVVDDEKGSKAKELLKALVHFGPEVHRCREWFNCPPTRQCSVCQRWGHTAYNCRVHSSFCTICAEPHPTSAHHYSCKSEGCAGKCQCETERCINCKGHHGADSNTCPFWLAKSNPNKMKELIEKKQKEQEASRAPRKTSSAATAKGK